MLKRRVEQYNVLTGRFEERPQASADEQLAALSLEQLPLPGQPSQQEQPPKDMRSFMSFALRSLAAAHAGEGAFAAAMPPCSKSSFEEASLEAAPLPCSQEATMLDPVNGASPDKDPAGRAMVEPPAPFLGLKPSALPLQPVGSFSPAEVNSGHLHYGGSVSPKTKALGCKPEAGRAFRQQKRLELMVRMENAAIPDSAAAQMLCVTLNYYKTIKKSTSYLKARTQITLGLVVDQASSLEAIREQRKEMLTQMLPQALQVIANAVHRPAHSLAEQKHQVAVAQDLLDREGTFAKISRAEIRPVDSFDWSTVDERGRSITEVIRGAQMLTRSRSVEVQDTIELSQAFSRGRSLDPKEQQSALEDLEKTLLQAVPSASEKLQ